MNVWPAVLCEHKTEIAFIEISDDNTSLASLYIFRFMVTTEDQSPQNSLCSYKRHPCIANEQNVLGSNSSFYFISFLGQKMLFECSHSFPLHLLYCYILWHHTVLPRRSLWCHEKGLRSSRRCDTERKCLYVFKHYGNCKHAFQNCQEYMLWKDECLCGINSSCYTRTLECVVFSHCSLEPSISDGIWHTTAHAEWGLSRVRCVCFVCWTSSLFTLWGSEGSCPAVLEPLTWPRRSPCWCVLVLNGWGWLPPPLHPSWSVLLWRAGCAGGECF